MGAGTLQFRAAAARMQHVPDAVWRRQREMCSRYGIEFGEFAPKRRDRL